MSLAEFLAMGGYASFIWPAYGVAAAALIVLLVTSLRQLKARQRELAAAESERPRRGRDSTPAPPSA